MNGPVSDIQENSRSRIEPRTPANDSREMPDRLHLIEQFNYVVSRQAQVVIEALARRHAPSASDASHDLADGLLDLIHRPDLVALMGLRN